MYFLLNADVQPGLATWERAVYVKRLDGTKEEILVPVEATQGSYVKVELVNVSCNEYLVEYPQESSSGNRRAWVSANQIKVMTE